MKEWTNLKVRKVLMRVLQVFSEATFVWSFVINCAIFWFYFIDLDTCTIT